MSFVGGGNVPFSWEHLPGVSKFNTQKHPTMSFRSPKPKHFPSSSHKYDILEEQIKIIPPPPPFSFQDPPRRSLSRRFLWKIEEEDPFLEALKECTKGASNSWRSKLINFPAGSDIKKKSYGMGGMSLKSLLPKFRKNKFILSCNGSLFDVEENNLMMPSNSSSVPDYQLPIPRERVQGLIKLQERLRYRN